MLYVPCGWRIELCSLFAMGICKPKDLDFVLTLIFLDCDLGVAEMYGELSRDFSLVIKVVAATLERATGLRIFKLDTDGLGESLMENWLIGLVKLFQCGVVSSVRRWLISNSVTLSVA